MKNKILIVGILLAGISIYGMYSFIKNCDGYVVRGIVGLECIRI